MDKIRVLIVDDSLLMRKIISDILLSDPQFEIVDKARNGKEVMDKVLKFNPDVITLDVNLPLLDGLSVLKEVMETKPTRVIMLSAYTRQGAAATMKALELGAVDFIAKPSGEVSADLQELKQAIIAKIKIAAQIDFKRFLSTLKHPVTAASESKVISGEIKKLVVIGASTGGPRAILQIMEQIPANLPAAFLIVQHMPEGFTLSFAERISWESRIKTKEAEDGDIVMANKAYVAPAGFHATLKKIWTDKGAGLKIKLNHNPPVHFVRPSIDVLMSSAAEVYGSNTIGVVLTGMGKDGLGGAGKIKQVGGRIIVQDEATSVVWGMPRVIVEAGLADYVLPLSQIPAAIINNIER
ncbi:MAG: chemotaxis response regulator protein-glutamate methylesterase [Candidatus Omnitrophota bacterium]